jgi:hypothetical protein
MLYIFYNGYKCVSLVFHTYVASVSIVLTLCCKCFHLDVVKVYLGVAHVAVDPTAAATCCSCCARLHVRGCGGGAKVRARDMKCARSTVQVSDTVQVQDTERRGPPRARHPDASPDFRALECIPRISPFV